MCSHFVFGVLPFLSACLVWQFLPCLFTCCIFLCAFILFTLLYLGSPVCRLESFSSSYCGVFTLEVKLDQCLLQVSCLERTCACVLMDGTDLVPLKDSPLSSNEFWGWSVHLVWLWVTCLLMCSVVFLFYWKTGMGHLGIEALWSLSGLGFDAEMEAFGKAFTY